MSPSPPNKIAPSLDELLERNVATIHQIEETARSQRDRATKIADAIASFCGSITFVWVHIAWFGVWLVLNTVPTISKAMRFDPPPFSMLTLVVSLEAIFLSTFILISQNRQQAIAEQRNNLDLQINLLAEQENSEMIRLLGQICTRLGVNRDLPQAEILAEQTDPLAVVEKLEESSRELGKPDIKGK